MAAEIGGSAVGWRPIGSAPKDGSYVLVYVAAREGLRAFQTVLSYQPDVGWCADEIRSVTHWMPLPRAP